MDQIALKRVSPGGKTTYIPVEILGHPPLSNVGVSPAEAGSIMGTIAYSMMMSMSEQLPDHSKYRRESDKLLKAVAEFIRSTSGTANEELVELSLCAWRSATNVILNHLGEYQVRWSTELQEKIDEAKAKGWTERKVEK